MKRLSIKHRMLRILSLSTVMVFVVLLISFNLLMQGFMRKEASRDLKESLNQVEQVITAEFPNLDALLRNRPNLARLATRLQEVLKNRLLLAQQNFIITDKNFNLILNSPLPGDQSEKLIEDLLRQVGKLDPAKGKVFRVIVHKKTFYAAYISPKSQLRKDRFNLLFYTDMTSLANFSRNINRVLFWAVGLSAIIALLLVYVFTSKTSRAIKSLGAFAKAIGKGDLKEHSMTFKDQELHELGADMNLMARRLKEQENQQKTFFQNVSHEFKTPLMSIQGYTESIKYNVIEDKDRACDIIIEECRRLSDMVSDLILISQLENKSESVHLAPAELKAILSDLCERVYGLARGHSKELVLSLPSAQVKLMADEEKLSRAILNLLTNGLRYARQKVELVLSVEASKAVITITDDGEGFAEKDLPHIFDRFYKGAKGQTGLGLTIAKSIIAAHEGSIEACNTSAGARFTITLKTI